jgi:uncharacterized protein
MHFWVAPTYLAGFPSWPRRAWLVSAIAVTAGCAAALVLGYVQPIGVASIAVMALLAVLCGLTPKGIRAVVLHSLCFVFAGLLSLHLLPGFQNPLLIGPVSFTPDAIPFKMYLNFDKAAVGFALVLFYVPICLTNGIGRSLLIGASGATLAIILTLPLALLLGAVRWEPKLPDSLWLWSLDNFFLVALTEEALFRGFLQGSLSRWLDGGETRLPMAIVIAAIVFGLAHYASGVPMVLLASLAGVAYGLAYRYGGLPASMLAHFGLNLFHIVLFSYPLLAPR